MNAASFSASVAAERPVFLSEPVLMSIPTYDGSGQSVHPDVVAFGSAWHGARYWLTMTPYPKSDQHLENPSILASDDGESVRVPGGVANPVIKAPGKRKDYNSDPELVYEPQSDQLVLFHRFVEAKTNTIHVATSHDGVTWTHLRAPFWERAHNLVSPTVAPRAAAPARMWYVSAGKAGCDARSTTVMLRTATDTTGRVVDTKWAGATRTDLSIPGYNIWHIKARWIPEKTEYWMLISAFPVNGDGCKTDDLFFARSTDGQHWTAYAQPVLRHQDRAWTAATVYRSSFLYDAANDVLELWISGRGTDGTWGMGHARARFSTLLSALERNVQVSPNSRVVYTAPALQPGDLP